MTDIKDVVVIGNKRVYDCKGKTGLCVPDTWEDFSKEGGDFRGARAKGDTLYVTVHIVVGQDANENDILQDVELTFKNATGLQDVYFTKSKKENPVFPDDYETDPSYYDFVIAPLTTYDEEKYIITGSNFNDKIDISESDMGYTINAGNGNDTITGSQNEDIISGGAGNNTINYTDGNDFIKLTKGENLTVNLSGLGLDEEDISYTANNDGDLVVNFDAEQDGYTIGGFVKSDVTGKNGSVKYTLDGETYKSYDDIEVGFSEVNLTKNEKKNTATLNGSRFNDYVEIQGLSETLQRQTENAYKININDTVGNNTIELHQTRNSNIVTTGAGDDTITLEDTSNPEKYKKAVTKVNAGAGTNNITIFGDGNNVVTTGKGNDTFTIEEGESTTTINAGGGENTVHIKDSDFGQITLTEEKAKAQNHVLVDNITETYEDGSYIYHVGKKGNDLIIGSDESEINIKSYFVTGKKNAVTDINGQDLAELLKDTGLSLYVSGSGTVKGTDLNEIIKTDDSYGGKAKNDKIYAGKGNDIINAGDGKNFIYMYAGDGIDTIENGYGIDTLVFKKGTSINIGFAETNDCDEHGNTLYDLRIYYSKDKSDYALIKGAVVADGDTYVFNQDETSVEKIKVGSKTYKLEALINRNKIENVLKDGKVVGTVKHDDIYVTDTTKFKNADPITINGDKGNDVVMIGSNTGDGDEEDHNVDPANYSTVNIKPTVYTHTTDGNQDTTLGVYDKVVSYASGNGTYYAQSAISDIKVYGIDTDDTYNTYYNNQFTKLYDESGDNDVLHIKDKEHSDLKLIFDVTKDYKDWGTEIAKIDKITDANKHDVVSLMVNSLQEVKIVTSDDRNYFLENPDENNDIGIDIDYWGDKDAHDSEGDFDEKTTALLFLGKDKLAKFGGGIEKISASDGYYITSEDIASVASNVAEWLTDKGYASVDEVLTDEKTAGDMAALLEVFDNIEWRSPIA